MKKSRWCLLLTLIVGSCYEYVEYKHTQEPEPTAIAVPVIKPNLLHNVAFATRGEKILVVFSQEESTISQAVTNAIIRYFRSKGNRSVYRVSRKTIYGIVRTIPRRSLRSRDRNLVYSGESITFRLPRVVYATLTGDNYYSNRQRVYGMGRIRDILAVKWLMPYEAHVFDCSEKSAFMEYWLERNGLNTDIVADSSHSWLMVEAEPGNWVDVEATGDGPSLTSHRKYTHRFRDIYDAIRYFETEYDWWNSITPGKGIIGR